ncbi:hypothetical protein B0H13DRAFT_2006129 [Mycena leptocephala]|nr:hypothetical protein B0H13DRAFT_2006129 [Mycena leptocephala]
MRVRMGMVRWRGRALVLIRVWVVSLWMVFGAVAGTGRGGGGAAAEDVFVGDVALGAGQLAGAQRSIHPRQDSDERSKT